MLRDVFYFGNKPNSHPREQHANDLEHARSLSTTEHFWVITEYSDYKNFDWDWDFDFLPDEDVWTKDFNNVWPSEYDKDSGTWLCTELDVDTFIYRTDVSPIKLKKDESWKFLSPIDPTSIDLSWAPDPSEPPYIYTWGNKYIPAEIEPTLEYHVDGATDRKYMGDVRVFPQLNRWTEHVKVDETKFDFNWRPDPREPAFIYVWGNKYHAAEIKPTVEYTVPGATEKKYMGIVDLAPEWDRWKQNAKVCDFDFSWRPDPNLHEPPFIYVWGNKYIPAEVQPTLEYTVPGATEKKYLGNVSVEPEYEKWKEFVKVTSEFDKSWRPDPREPAFIYVWGNEYEPAEIKPTIQYTVPGAIDVKYMGDAPVEPEWDKWQEYISVDRTSFNLNWRPDPREPAFIYVWGNKFHPAEQKTTIEYKVPGATEKKYMGIVDLAPEWDRWNIIVPIDMNSFDFRWRPDPNLHEPAMVYVFGNKWNDSKTEPTIEYVAPGATVKKYMDYPVAIPKSDMSMWTVNNKEDLETFDFSWRPNPHSPAQIYQWVDNGPRYNQLGATEVVLMEYVDGNRKVSVNRYPIKTTLEALIEEHIEEVFWALNPDLTYDRFDFNWRPTNENFRHINVFGNEYSKNTQTYYINGPMYKLGHREMNYVVDQTVDIESNLTMFYIDRGRGVDRYDALKLRYPQLQKTRYLNSWVETMQRCCNKSETKLFWVLNSELDYSEFMFDFYPSPWQMDMVHVFGTQWSHWGNTYLVNKETFEESTKYVKVIEHLNILNFVKNKRTKAVETLYDIVYIDHGNVELKPEMNVVKYEESYLKTFTNMLATLPSKKEHHIWVCSTICDYDNFDFTYICDPYAKDQLHVFPSDKQKFGDTFLIDVNKLRTLIDTMVVLEDYVKINYNQHQTAKRLPAPIFINESDTHVSINDFDFNWPYATILSSDNKEIKVIDNEPMSLWSLETKNIIVQSAGGTCVTVPREAKNYVKKELYDYPYIKRVGKLAHSNPLDIIFFSNGEANADQNYEHLLFATAGLSNRVIRVDGINGRVASQHAAANASNTPWYFLVNAKLKVNQKFDWDWQPDRLQIPKHYIFTATNPVNHLEYGHQAIVANNKKLTLNTVVKGLDFTMDSEHEVVNINCGIGMYNTSVWDTWRTAFREVLKLKYYTERNDDLEAKFRLSSWLNLGDGEFGKYSTIAALDACRYYESVNGELDKLRLSYDWEWLRTHYERLYPK